MAPAEDNDSGMESQEGSQSLDQENILEKETSTKPRKQLEIDESEDDEPDETLAERLWGLTEMFPEPVRNITYATFSNTQSGIKKAYTFSRSAMWIVFSTSIILFAPVIFEVERAQVEEMQKNQQKQLLLGPNSAISGGVPPPIMPPMPQQRS
ncbi:translocase of outer mitochondrial membrane 22 homolog mge isoform X1 [Leptinotarsa decemlineata]|uniref:translocase of outer mitochondrial membrane 22 homolog mge isoform X1 n=2 Tax=Leptinotarsa decemlineata TaxID=7539 RepID=UPI000C2532D7|nr:mitochondrial import receptor subunit TOM22 homolog isoform X1 [Leptinotarsa decemlineata]XP_023016784.1 mitochondrial import receptor subunit TOM22 homolog isoform X1 [Leptinotarsa decemlineata]